jgi:hypothetical protein
MGIDDGCCLDAEGDNSPASSLGRRRMASAQCEIDDAASTWRVITHLQAVLGEGGWRVHDVKSTTAAPKSRVGGGEEELTTRSVPWRRRGAVPVPVRN